MLRHILISMRPRQWTKNLFLFAGIIFAQKLISPVNFTKVVLAFIIFSISSGGIYIFNDIIDRESDKVHPDKKNRPVASGVLSLPIAWISSLVMIVAGLSFSYILSRSFFLLLLAYVILMVVYSLFLKRLVLLDIIIVAFGFVLRTLAGCAVIDVTVSPWLFICTLMLALFIAASKRRQEIISLGSSAKHHRLPLVDYTPELIDKILLIVTACTLVAYTLYTLSPMTVEKFGGNYMVFTVPFVLYGIMRYFYLIHKEEDIDSPERIIIKDKALLVDILLWVLSVIAIIYFL